MHLFSESYNEKKDVKEEAWLVKTEWYIWFKMGEYYVKASDDSAALLNSVEQNGTPSCGEEKVRSKMF